MKLKPCVYEVNEKGPLGPKVFGKHIILPLYNKSYMYINGFKVNL